MAICDVRRDVLPFGHPSSSSCYRRKHAPRLRASLFKYLYGRPRPDFAIAGIDVLSNSFPSGHTSVSTTTYLVIAALLSRSQHSRHANATVFAIAATLCLLIGLSRIYLGAHWPSDVLAGWMLGGSWALIAIRSRLLRIDR
ncbi:MAG: phosphatase PAP2 family protein [Alphaproteobacteria bacterium]|nr:phosphatase PAP2 family protein [Reyranella sp.]MBL6940082.1 phosphatase PAP2 family protein [Alphaproteobacteria bacterium]MBL7100169.1 phosphatase PAP2 family protein [Alphaproteobacteria bacterium]